ncbi:MAG: acyltransferase [Acidobacteriota bacterium]|nr:acyltransferase [Acidobacteriota bacterium]
MRPVAAMAAVTHPEKKHNAALDGVRGIAILLVLLHHWQIPLPASNRFTPAMLAVTGSCWVGVDLFFALSGFLITGILVDTVESTHFLKNFYARRFLRIFPLYYGVIVVLVLLTPLLHFAWGAMLPLLLFYLQNTGIGVPLDHYRLAHGVNLNPYWSLAVEEQFYLVWPLMVFWLRDVTRLTKVAFALSGAALILRIVLMGVGVSPWFVYCFTACRADTLLLGGALALLLRSKRLEVREGAVRWIPVVAGMAFVGVAGFAVRFRGLDWQRGWFVQTAGYTLIAVAACGLIAWTQRKGSGRLLGHPALRFFGRYSYGIYMLHLLWFRPLYKLIEGQVAQVLRWWQVAAVLSWLVAAGLVIGVAVLSFKFYETLFLRLKRHFDYR